ncbi:MAG: replicative DNA helicase [Parcubacteria group bacterium CG_4_9_14_0_2_um_filter_41_8]|nr:MAG: replicative DNA helicase [Parcubacteria group bacterium CG1_02_41_12]PIQ79399.1 MAG: replicative DNA helicase [Parcubacteria group bacterium CG11_big_fil_rev_8_21_14_0_20_41_14]PIR57539.1 MAG: replicative DNA helicase [Parcubacteria group bacterium CG10_big_fil_rev_8_21_14_0_10_41_35]PJC40335.1 MAG: replicative DNA helicase [Parcubacteria group bacterium CG_4_9_14_0_2_um_filter_41_8]
MPEQYSYQNAPNERTQAQGIERIPPQNLEAEQSVLGSLLLDQDALIKIGDVLVPEDFYKDIHKVIFKSMLELFDRHEPIDLLSLSSNLSDKKQLDIIGGRSYLADLTNSVPSAANVVNYAQIVRKKSTLRNLLYASHEITQLGYAENDDVDALLDQAEQKLFSISQRSLRQNFISIRSVLNDTFERIEKLHQGDGKLRGISTGFADLDDKLSGLQKSDLVIVAARPSVGKTSLALDFARTMAVNEKKSVGIFSLEMSKEQLVDRLLCTQAGVELWRMRTGKLSQATGNDDFPRIGHAMGELSEANIFIDDAASINIMEIRTKARRLYQEHGVDCIIVDYLQLMEGRSSGNSDNRVQEVAEITRALKSIARELDIPVIALSQLSRAVEQQQGPAIPRLSHLRESGTIEQDADVVMFIYRKSADRKYDARELSPEERNLAEIHIAKHRNGPTGIVNLFFNEKLVSFQNLAKGAVAQRAPNQHRESPPPETVDNIDVPDM